MDLLRDVSARMEHLKLKTSVLLVGLISSLIMDLRSVFVMQALLKQNKDANPAKLTKSTTLSLKLVTARSGGKRDYQGSASDVQAKHTTRRALTNVSAFSITTVWEMPAFDVNQPNKGQIAEQ